MIKIMKVHSDSSSVVELAQERIYVLMIHIGAIKNQKYLPRPLQGCQADKLVHLK